MKLKMCLAFVLCCGALAALANSIEAQRPWPARSPLTRYHRFVGGYYSDGYHRCNPGPDVSYYNPWSAHNTSKYLNRNEMVYETMEMAPYSPAPSTWTPTPLQKLDSPAEIPKTTAPFPIQLRDTTFKKTPFKKTPFKKTLFRKGF
jgi:hypothetical protein